MRKANYKKLFKLLIDLEISKKELAEMAGISASTVTKMVKAECVNMDMIVKICNVLNCELNDIVELTSDAEADHHLKKQIDKRKAAVSGGKK